jgi:hypothetical protein
MLCNAFLQVVAIGDAEHPAFPAGIGRAAAVVRDAGQARVVRIQTHRDDEDRHGVDRHRRVDRMGRGPGAGRAFGQSEGAQVSGGAETGRTAGARIAEALLRAVRHEHDDVVAAVDRRVVREREDRVDEVVVGIVQRAGERRSGRGDDDVAGVLLEPVLAHVRGRRVVADDR